MALAGVERADDAAGLDDQAARLGVETATIKIEFADVDRAILDGRIALDLSPGDYRLQMAEFARVVPGPSRHAQYLVESYATLRVAADGSAEPGVLVFAGR